MILVNESEKLSIVDSSSTLLNIKIVSEVAATAAAYKVPWCLEDLTSAVISHDQLI